MAALAIDMIGEHAATFNPNLSRCCDIGLVRTVPHPFPLIRQLLKQKLQENALDSGLPDQNKNIEAKMFAQFLIDGEK